MVYSKLGSKEYCYKQMRQSSVSKSIHGRYGKSLGLRIFNALQLTWPVIFWNPFNSSDRPIGKGVEEVFNI